MWIGKLKSQLSDQLVRGFSWMALMELAHRIMRLGTVVILARTLTPYDYGLTAIVFLTVEFANVFAVQGGITNKLIQADEEDVGVLSDTAYWLNWIVCIAVFIVQCLAAFPIAWFYHDARLILPICVAASVYLIIPVFTVQSGLILRENRMKIIAIANMTNSVISNVLTIGFALMGFGMWSIVLSHVLSNVSWLTVYLKNHRWRPPKTFTLQRWQEILWFAKDPIAIGLLDKLRANLDYLLVGRFIGVEALGVYYFAFNAGLGISLNVIRMFAITLLPYFCEVRGEIDRLREKYFKGLKVIAAIALPIIVLQSSLAPFYVPIVFGQRWIEAIPVMILICLSAIPRPFALAAEQLLLSVDKGWISLRWNLIFTTIFAAALLISVQWNILTVAACVLVVHLVALPVFVVWTTRYVFGRSLIWSK
ncbi:plobable polysaccharide biosynthesis protein [Leptolyngbya sp. NIES-3755]|nr:plobable polysaccharide biosynthesis protein [Leptolyngbya sp. NIES-3755]